MKIQRTFGPLCVAGALGFAGGFAGPALAQAPGQAPGQAQGAASTPFAGETLSLTVPKDTPVQVALAKEIRVAKVGQAIEGRVVEPVYSFDKVVIPVGTRVTGQITRIDPVPGGKRTEAALDADFTPSHAIHVEFNQLVLPDGKTLPVHTNVTPGSGQPISFVSAPDEASQKRDPVAEKAAQAKQQAKQDWNAAMKQIKEPGKAHRVERYLMADLPVHPQYIDAGTVYLAELQEPLDFGTEPLTPELASSIGSMPAGGAIVQTRLLTPLSSATAHQGDAVEAIVSRPLIDGGRVILPQGTLLRGSVIQVHRARKPGRNGELRLVFHQMRLADGVEQKVEASLAGVQAASADHVSVDAEGGTHASEPNTRFLTTTLAVGLGAFAFIGDSGGGDLGHSTAGGAGGYKLIGIAVALAVRSQSFGMAMGAFGGARSIYTNFVARGHDVVFPKDTTMEIGVASGRAGTVPGAPAPPTTAR